MSDESSRDKQKNKDESNEEFGRFEDLTKKLLKVPKEELDGVRANREREKRAG